MNILNMRSQPILKHIETIFSSNILDRTTKFWKKINVLLYECKNVILAIKARNATLISSLWVWISVNTITYLKNDYSLPESLLQIAIPFIAPLVIAPSNQLYSYFQNKKLKSLKEHVFETAPWYILEINKNTWYVLLASQAARNWLMCPINPESFLEESLFQEIMTYYTSGETEFIIKHNWEFYKFYFWTPNKNNPNDIESDIIWIHWYNITKDADEIRKAFKCFKDACPNSNRKRK